LDLKSETTRYRASLKKKNKKKGSGPARETPKGQNKTYIRKEHRNAGG